MCKSSRNDFKAAPFTVLSSLKTPPRENGPLPHRIDRYLDLAEHLACSPREAGNFSPPPLPPRPPRPRLALAPDTELGPAAEWPIHHYKSLIELLKDTLDPEVFIISMPDAASLADALTQSLNPNANAEQLQQPSDSDFSFSLSSLCEVLPTFSAHI